jgi:heme-degrading monooxygenase HmoA
MVVKVIIKRVVPKDKAMELIPYIRQLRLLATDQKGYISGETLKSLDKPDSFLVISNWQSPEAWEKWLLSKERQGIQEKIDTLLGGNTEYEMFHYGFPE